MIIPDEYKTGNKGMDDKIARALNKANVNGASYNKTILDEYNGKPYNKYGVSSIDKRTYIDGQVFASAKEMNRYDYLLKLEYAGQIKDLETQVPFELQEGFISRQWGDVRPIVYVADFVYINVTYRTGYEGRRVVEDSKGKIVTPVYKMKKKMFLYKYGNVLFFEV